MLLEGILGGLEESGLLEVGQSVNRLQHRKMTETLWKLTPFGSGTASLLCGAEIICLYNGRSVSFHVKFGSFQCRRATYSGLIAHPGDTSARAASSHLPTAMVVQLLSINYADL